MEMKMFRNALMICIVFLPFILSFNNINDQKTYMAESNTSIFTDTIQTYTTTLSTTATTTYTITTTTAIGWLTVKTDKYSYHPGDFVYIAGEIITPSMTWDYIITDAGVGKGLSVKIEIFDPNGNLIKSDNTDPNVAKYKSYAYNFSIKPDAILGIYKIHVSYSLFGNKIEGYGSFCVSDVYHDLPSDDPSDYIQPYDPLVQEVVKRVCKQPYDKYMAENAKALYYWVCFNIKYVHDKDRYGVIDYWQTPATTIRLRTGDCEDQAILLVSLLRAAGYSKDRVHLVFGVLYWLWGEPIGGHAWVEIKLTKAQTYSIASPYFAELEGKEVVINTNETDVYSKFDKEKLLEIQTFGIGSREGWIPLDTCVEILPNLIPVPFSAWVWFGYYVYYAFLMKAQPQYFYTDKETPLYQILIMAPFEYEIEHSVITCFVSKPIIDIEKGESVMIFGSISPPHSAPVTIEYSLDGEAWYSLTIVNSNLDGSFSYVWIPSNTGTYCIRASWRGDSDHVGSTSYPTEGLELQAIPEFSFYPSIPLLTISLIIAILFMQKYRRLTI
jgi:hypothetical protein